MKKHIVLTLVQRFYQRYKALSDTKFKKISDTRNKSFTAVVVRMAVFIIAVVRMAVFIIAVVRMAVFIIVVVRMAVFIIAIVRMAVLSVQSSKAEYLVTNKWDLSHSTSKSYLGRSS